MRKLLIVFICIFISGCTPLENNARDAAASAQGFITQAQVVHGDECKANPGLKVCLVINSSIAAQNVLIDTLETYCGWTARPTPDQLKSELGQPCQRVKTAQVGLQSAVSNLNTILSDLKTFTNK